MKTYISNLLKIKYTNRAINDFFLYKEQKTTHPNKSESIYKNNIFLRKIFELGLDKKLENKIKTLDHKIFEAHCIKKKRRYNYEREISHISHEGDTCKVCSKKEAHTCNRKGHCRPDLGHYESITYTDYEFGLYKHPLIIPDFLKTEEEKNFHAELDKLIAKLKKDKQMAENKDITTTDNTEKETKKIIIEANEEDSDCEREAEESTDNNQEPNTKETKETIIETDEEKDSECEKELDTAQQEEEKPTPINQTPSFTTSNKNNTKQKSSKRKQKQKNRKTKKQESDDRKELSGESQQTLEVLFSGNKQKLTYRKFQKLWENLGGNIQSSRGSHKTLYYGKKALGGIFSHGDNEKYGKGYHKWLKTPISRLYNEAKIEYKNDLLDKHLKTFNETETTSYRSRIRF